MIQRLLDVAASPREVAVEVSFTGADGRSQRVFLGWGGQRASDDASIWVSVELAECTGLRDGMAVEATLRHPLAAASRVHVVPASADDWEVMERNQAFLEQEILSQASVVYPGLVFPMWVRSNAVVRMRVAAVEPDAPVLRLVEHAELVIAPRVRESEASRSSPFGVRHALRLLPPSSAGRATVAVSAEDARAFDWPVDGVVQVGRLYAALEVRSDVPRRHIRADAWTFRFLDTAPLHAIQVALVPPSAPFRNASPPHSIALHPISDSHTPISDSGTPISDSDSVAPKLSRPCVLCNGGVAYSIAGVPMVIEFVPRAGKEDAVQPRFAVARASGVVEVEGAPVDPPLVKAPAVSVPPLVTPDPPPLGGVDEFVRGLRSRVATQLQAGAVRPFAGALGCAMPRGVVVLEGAAGSGKSAVMRRVAHELVADLVACEWVECAPAQGLQPDGVLRRLREAFDAATAAAPALLVLDDLFLVAPAEPDDAPNHAAAVVAAGLRRLLDSTRAGVAVVATAPRVEDLHGVLRQPEVVVHSLVLRAPDAAARAQVLSAAALARGRSTLGDAVERAARETEGYMAGDLVRVIDRARVFGRGRVLGWCDFERALSGFRPAALQGVALVRSDVRRADVGGLRDALAAVHETIEWPSKYDFLFESSELRARSGLLLYGPPGCGKTLLARMVAGSFGLNFIHIAGPELLNKYIGASEMAVRQAFDRAQAAKPCVLFFDEFDSVAPRRGHDSTGVTDRVVNQLLTQLDGVEGLDGVYVLAATSRPDLIDAALLRPGRLDRAVYCGMPGPDDRLEIAETLRCRYDMPPPADLRAALANAEHFSGADVQALIYQAFLLAVHERLDAAPAADTTDAAPRPCRLDGTAPCAADIASLEDAADEVRAPHALRTPTSSPPPILMRHIDQALQTCVPSVSASERRRFSAIYQNFVGSRGGTFASLEHGTRQSLM